MPLLPVSRYVAIVGHEAAKFTAATEATARAIIRELLADPLAVCVSGRCHLGGIDVWAVEEATALGRQSIEYPPAELTWNHGFRPRNVQIATRCTEAHCIVVTRYPETYRGMRFTSCYHCQTDAHIKSGGCWTTLYAQRLGKEARWHLVT